MIFERSDDVGGVWRDNSYPGCRCDIPARLYSYSFAPKSDWSDRFASQPEIWQYLRDCVTSFGLTKRLKTGCNVTAATWRNESGRWDVATSRGPISARMIVVASGTLNEPLFPEIEGIDGFTGTSFHSSQWPRDFDVRSKNIAVVGTGASSVQIVPEIAPLAESITVFQRTPAWVVRRGDRAIARWCKRLYASVPLAGSTIRWFQFISREVITGALVNSGPLLSLIERAGRRHLKQQVADPALRAKLTPDFRPGCKRILFSDDWYPSLGRSNVDLVTDPITHITADGITTADGTHRTFDAIVFGTGFQINRLPMPFVITGTHGKTLAQVWGRSRPSAYLGTTASAFPNMAIMTGPNTGLGSNSMVLMIEAQANYLSQMARYLADHPTSILDVRDDVAQRYLDDVQRRIAKSVWATGGCQSWYKDHKGRVVAMWPGTTSRFARMTRKWNINDYYVRSL